MARNGYKPPVRPIPRPKPQVSILPPPAREAADENESKDSQADQDLAGAVREAIRAGMNYDRDEVQPDRTRNKRFYLGDISEELPQDEDGSSVVSRDVHDVVHASLPSFHRVFFKGDKICEFVPHGPEDEPKAAQADDYLNWLVRRELGVVGFNTVVMDAMLSKIGIVKWWWDESKRVVTETHTGLDPLMFELLQQPEGENETIEVIEQTEHPAPARPNQPSIDVHAPGAQPPQPPSQALIDCKVRRTTSMRKLRLEAVPPEERIIDGKAKSVQGANYYGQRTYKTISDLVAMGYDREEILEHATLDDSDLQNYADRQLRQPGEIEPLDDPPTTDMQTVEYVELYIRYDEDGDGVAELLRVCCIGDANEVLDVEPATQIPFAEFQVKPQPHIATGRATADDLVDVQIVKSGLHRNVMESLPHSVYPRLAFLENMVNPDDVLSTAPGQPIRVRGSAQTVGNAIQSFTHEFVGQAAMAVADKWDEIKNRRTGISDASQGLDPDALQSTGEMAAAATITASQSQLEYSALMLAHTGFRDLFRGLLREIVEHQNEPEVIRLRGTWVQIDPREWSPDMDVQVHPGIGGGTDSQKIAALTQIASSQKDILTTLGPVNNLVTPSQFAYTLRKLAVLSGQTNPDNFFLDPDNLPQQVQQALQAKQSQPPPPNPNLIVAQAEAEKIKADIAREQQKMISEDARAWAKIEADVIFRVFDTAAKNGTAPMDPISIIAALRTPQPAPSELPPGTPLQPIGLQMPQGQPYPVNPPVPLPSPVLPPTGILQ